MAAPAMKPAAPKAYGHIKAFFLSCAGDIVMYHAWGKAVILQNTKYKEKNV